MIGLLKWAEISLRNYRIYWTAENPTIFEKSPGGKEGGPACDNANPAG